MAIEQSNQVSEIMVRHDVSLLGEQDLHLFNEGTHNRLYEKLGARLITVEGVSGGYFAVWAPNARQVSVIGDFNSWKKGKHLLRSRGNSGIWDGFIPGISHGYNYKFHIFSAQDNYRVDKADPLAFHAETPPRTASIIWDLGNEWHDAAWMDQRRNSNMFGRPMSIYEVHFGSWMRVPEENNRFLTYREMAHKLTEYVLRLGFTHVEFLPVMEHPFYGSWGYQTTAYFAPTSRYGAPQDFMYLVDYLHQHNIGIILDWVPSHFPNNEHGLTYFDGTHLYEHADPRQGFHPDWKSAIFNYGRSEVRSFLLSSALFWLDVYHVDALRVDAVASMLYLDYARKPGEWIPSDFGGRANAEAITFIRRMNEDIYKVHPDVQVIGEDLTAWPTRSPPTLLGSP